MRLEQIVCVALAAALGIVVVQVRMSSAAPTPLKSATEIDDEYWRLDNACGVNVVYTFLHLQGIERPYDQVRRDVDVGEIGSNLKQMRDVVCDSGVGAVVIRSSPNDLYSRSMPVIAHLDRDATGGFDVDQRGHYVVLLSADRETVRYIDGTTGAIMRERADLFVRQWSGFLLVKERNRYQWRIVLWLIGGAALTGFSGLMLRRRAKVGGRPVA